MMQAIHRTIMTHRRPLLFVGIFIIFFLWSYITLDSDFGWHLRSGQYFIDHGVPKYDIFTYTAGNFHWVNHEWLSDIVVALVYHVGSFELLSVLYAGMWTAAIAIMGRKVHPAFLIAASVAILPFAGVRALTWSVLGLALLTLIIRQKNKKWRVLIPLLFLVWANFHGSFLIGIAYGGWQVIREKSWKLAVIGVIALAMTFVNPYGAELYTEVFRTMFDGDLHATINEWARFAIPLAAVPYVLTWVGLTIYRHQRDWRRYIRFETLLFIMAVASVRMTPLFILSSLTGLQQTTEEIGDALPKKDRPRGRQVAKIAALVLVAVTLVLPVIETVAKSGASRGYPAHAVQYLTDHPCRGNLFNSYNYGGYLIWQLPSHKVYIDGRMPSWEHETGTYMKDYNKVLSDEVFRAQQFEKYGITCVLIEKDTDMFRQLKDQGWQIKAEDSTSNLLIKP